MTNFFFAFNHQNYCQHYVLYLQNLQRVNETHLGLNIYIGIKRTKRPYSRRPIDYTVETAINTDAAKRCVGVMNVSNSLSARVRWAKSHSLRTEIVSHVLAENQLQGSDEVTSDLKASNIEKSFTQIQDLKNFINDRLNPFSPLAKPEVLYNISNRQSASVETEKFLLTFFHLGNEQKKFIQECLVDSTRYEKSIKKHVLCTFKKKRVKKLNMGKQKSLKFKEAYSLDSSAVRS